MPIKVSAKRESGVMLVLGDKAWGTVYADGHTTVNGWVPIEDAPLHEARYVKVPEDITYKDDPRIPEMKKGQLVRAVRTQITNYTIVPINKRPTE